MIRTCHPQGFHARLTSRRVLRVPQWADAASIEAVYGDPAFQEAFATLFEAPPTLTVYTTTDWYQWP